MKPALFEYPPKTAFGRVLPKSKVYEHGRPSAAVKELFVRQVEQVVWQNKLAPETLNLKRSKAVPEIQIFSVTLKGSELKAEVLRCIDLAIPFPLIFELHQGNKVKAVTAYKRPSAADGAKWVQSGYFETPWVSESASRMVLPVALNLEALYGRLIEPLLPFAARPGEGLQALVERAETARTKQREMEQLDSRLRKEKQFNRKMEMNAELRHLSMSLGKLTRD